MNRLSKYHFWEWFKRHHQEFLDIRTKPKKEMRYWFNELNAHLRSYYKCFSFCIEWPDQQRTASLIITVEGKARHFKKADALVAKAPVIPGWSFLALEPARPADFMLEPMMVETGIDPRELQFSFDEGVLTVYHPLCTDENEHLFHCLANGAAYNLLGERSFGDDICEIEVANLSTADRENLQKMETLPECVQGRSAMMVDCKGNLVLL